MKDKKDRIQAAIQELEAALQEETAKNQQQMRAGREDVLHLATRLLEFSDPAQRFGPQDELIRSNSAATAPAYVGVVSQTLKTLWEYGPYAGRPQGSERVASRSGEDAGALAYSDRVNVAREKIERFAGIDAQADTLIYAINTSDAIGKLALTFHFSKDDVVLLPEMEHTSNFLPWLNCGATTVLVKQNTDGTIDRADFEHKLAENRGRVRLFTFTTASNISGRIPPIKELVGLAHEAGAMVALDCAQYAPHFPMDKKGWGADFTSFSAHKMGAPMGPGVLAVPKKWLEEHNSLIPGGGTISDVRWKGGKPQISWSPDEAKHQPGTWPTIGIISMGAAVDVITRDIGWEKLIEKEGRLLRLGYARLGEIPGFAPLFPVPSPGRWRTPVISFNIKGISPDRLVRELSSRGIQVRGGSQDPICNHLFIRQTLGLEGFVRISLGWHTTEQEVERIAAAVREVAGGKRM
ncbi:Cysteine desulfurase [uncultured archaeon]|nr:Cysteine desulfurase [uncultured archaeon]